mmetsp:Transcript_15803/g.40095  ORF Transcript_15803/g.40095 Transcript_15803/m.40095 type:complete len:109 (-) Transcript_15803:308-634(-)
MEDECPLFLDTLPREFGANSGLLALQALAAESLSPPSEVEKKPQCACSACENERQPVRGTKRKEVADCSNKENEEEKLDVAEVQIRMHFSSLKNSNASTAKSAKKRKV